MIRDQSIRDQSDLHSRVVTGAAPKARAGRRRIDAVWAQQDNRKVRALCVVHRRCCAAALSRCQPHPVVAATPPRFDQLDIDKLLFAPDTAPIHSPSPGDFGAPSSTSSSIAGAPAPSAAGGASPTAGLRSGPGLVNTRLGVVLGSSEHIGGRAAMEDRVDVCGAVDGDDTLVYAAVYDGHGGDGVAEFLRRTLPARILAAVTEELRYERRYLRAVAKAAAAASAAGGRGGGEAGSGSQASAGRPTVEADAEPVLGAESDGTPAAAVGSPDFIARARGGGSDGRVVPLPRTQSALHEVAAALSPTRVAVAAPAGDAAARRGAAGAGARWKTAAAEPPLPTAEEVESAAIGAARSARDAPLRSDAAAPPSPQFAGGSDRAPPPTPPETSSASSAPLLSRSSSGGGGGGADGGAPLSPLLAAAAPGNRDVRWDASVASATDPSRAAVRRRSDAAGSADAAANRGPGAGTTSAPSHRRSTDADAADETGLLTIRRGSSEEAEAELTVTEAAAAEAAAAAASGDETRVPPAPLATSRTWVQHAAAGGSGRAPQPHAPPLATPSLQPPPPPRRAGAARPGTAAVAAMAATAPAAASRYAPGDPDFRRILTYVFHAVDAEIAAEAAAGRMTSTAGACVALALLWGDALVVANVGDCEAWLCRGGRPYELTCPHKALRDSEAARIRATGGVVTFWHGTPRVGGASG